MHALKSTDHKRQSGFALVVALSLMAFVLMLILSMSLLVQVETTNASRSLDQLRAKEAARLALMMAMGELQKHAGPDQRVTARAEILGDSVQNGERYWTGVWDTDNPGNPPVWLVSGLKTDPTAPSTESLNLLGASSVDISSTSYPEQYVSAPTIKVNGRSNETVQEIAWWISDEGVKASVGTLPLNSRTKPNFLDDEEAAATELQIANTQGLEELFTNYDRFDPVDAMTQSRISSSRDLLFQNSFLDEDGKLDLSGDEAPVHSLNTGSYGVLANTLPSAEAEAGLMQDLSLYPGILGSGLEEYLQLGETNETQLSGSGVNGLKLFTNIQGIDNLPTLNDGDIALPVAPILTNFMVAFTVRSQSSADPNFYLRMRTFSEFWNPYTHTLKMINTSGNELDLELEITGLPTVTVSKTTGTLASSAPIDIQSLIGDPSSPGAPLVIQLEYNHIEDWLPGQSKNWNGVDANTATGPSPYLSIDRLYKKINNPLQNLGGSTGLETNEPRLSANLRHTSSGSNTLQIRVYLKDTDTGLRELVSELDGFIYEPISTRLTGYSNKHSGATFGYHILLRSPHHSSDDPEYYRGLWLRDHDPRNLKPQLNDDWYLDNDPENNLGSAYVPVKDGVVPLAMPIPEEISETTKTIEISDFRRLHDRSRGQYGNKLNKLWQDAPLFELPRQRVLSLASLQHIYFHNERPFQVGNSWGSQGSTDTSKWFDRYYFSGFSRNDNPNDYNPQAGVPNPTLINYALSSAETLKDWQAEAVSDQDAAKKPAEQLMVANRFNINSTSSAAWKAVLSSLRLNDWQYIDYDEDDTSNLSSLAVGNTNRKAMFARFSHSLAETYKATETPALDGSEPVAPSAFYRHGARRLSNEQLESLAKEIVKLIKLKGTPFMDMAELVSADISGSSLLEQAIANTFTKDGRQQWFHDWELNGEKSALEGSSIEIDHFSPGFLTQADILTAIGPMLAPRSDTFKIRTSASTYNQQGNTSGSATLEAIVQRLPTLVNKGSPSTVNFGREFKLVSINWINADKL